ncbi:restriction endonuclease subunit S [Paenarthrobacter sp. Z7-10]|uniref:restriction endonuclease subunit S n=1 Tax=Paenarthrobacter sp. Z7-10 TaxID=2787635 RepID=UPI0022A99825|nr:restriction endonuclease subunit S [Paenarthrobacter sp. Z7-10]MCZ2404944.1 restriction endonuclease subunit S [Paenarthrobacter sp. Z7-10]
MTVASQWESDWPIGRLKNALAVPVTDGPHSTPEFMAEGVPFLSVDAIQDGELVFAGCRYVSSEDHADFVRKARPHMNDLLMGKAASTGKIARVKTSTEFSIWSPLALIRINETLADPGFIEYCLKSPECQFEIDGYSNANTQKNIGMGDIPRISLPLPTLAIQATVARFLDGETAQIDQLIAKQERLIALLAEKRQAIITHAVTKGLDPTAPTKPSDIPWLGDIPAGWGASRMSYEVWVRARLGWKGLKAEEYVLDGVAFLSTPNIKGRDIDFKDVNRISQDRFEESPEIKLSLGDVVLAKDGSTLGTVNVVRELPEPATVNSSIAVLTPSPSIDGVYLFYLLQSDYLRHTIQLLKGGMGVPHLFQDDIRRFQLSLPSISEQVAIAGHLDRKTQRIDQLIAKVQLAVGLLAERRSALISAAVTGKIDVLAGASKP